MLQAARATPSIHWTSSAASPYNSLFQPTPRKWIDSGNP
jgi:hypothetical protein